MGYIAICKLNGKTLSSIMAYSKPHTQTKKQKNYNEMDFVELCKFLRKLHVSSINRQINDNVQNAHFQLNLPTTYTFLSINYIPMHNY